MLYVLGFQRGLNSKRESTAFSAFQSNGWCAGVNTVESQMICNSTHLNGYHSLPLKSRVCVQWQMQTKRRCTLWPVITIRPGDTNSLRLYPSFSPLEIKESRGNNPGLLNRSQSNGEWVVRGVEGSIGLVVFNHSILLLILSQRKYLKGCCSIQSGIDWENGTDRSWFSWCSQSLQSSTITELFTWNTHTHTHTT